MYAKVFASLWDGSLRGKSDAILVFVNLLSHADCEGFVDRHFKAISDETGLDLDRVKFALLELEAPDPESRSPNLQGTRIERIDDHRDWGWRVVNYLHYRNLSNRLIEREANRLRQARFREKHSPSPTPLSPPKQKQKQKQDVTPVTPRNEASVTDGVTSNRADALLLFDSLPESVRTEAVKAQWESWVSFRMTLKKVKRWDLVFKETIKMLSTFPEPKIIECLSQSIRNGWQGVFEPKTNTANSHHSTGLSPSVTLINNQNALERVEKRIHQIKERASSDAMGTMLSEHEKTELKTLYSARSDLKAKCNFPA